MASTYTDLLRLEKQADGENSSTWGAKVNTVFELIEDAISGMASISTTGGTTTLSANNSSTDESRMAILKISGVLVSNATIVIPSSTKKYTIWNNTTGSYSVTVKTSGGTGVVVPAGKAAIFCDGTDSFSLASIPPTTVMAFFQAAAPTGWTQVTSHNNKALRVVSGVGGGSGGTVAFTTAFASQIPAGTVGATTLTSAQIPSHTHTYEKTQTGSGNGLGGSAPFISTGLAAITGSTGGGGSHTHSFTGTAIDLAVQYIDMIIASKN